MNADPLPLFETDPRFPSGPWTGFFLQKTLPGKHTMELRLTFQNGAMTGEGRDWVGEFHVKGQYNLADGKCYWTKKYLGKHDVFYQGYNEGKGIWGFWEIGIPSLGARARRFPHLARRLRRAIGRISRRRSRSACGRTGRSALRGSQSRRHLVNVQMRLPRRFRMR